jgi:outer membrane lipoprotein-sorting protein
MSVFTFFLIIPLIASAQTPEEKGLEIFLEVDNRDKGFENFTCDGRMVLKNKHGQESIRSFHFKVLEVEGDGDKSLTVFNNPKDVKGTAFLSYSYKIGDDDQWLYLPALQRVKRISSRNKSGSFMGSEFSYEDIASQEVEKFTHKWLRDETYKGKECFVVERRPVDKYSGYLRQVNWVDKQEYLIQKIEFYDRKNYHLKTLVVEGYDLFLEKFWRPNVEHMTNHLNGKSTLISWSGRKFRQGITENDFSQNSLRRAR